MKGLKETNFKFPKQTGFYRGKVRDVYHFEDKLVIVATDRLSAFDVVQPKPIPYKGQVLNQIATKFLNETSEIVPNWLISTPDPNVAVGLVCEPFKVEMVIRGYVSGHAWREYSEGKRTICGVNMPNGLKESDRFETPIITPTTKASEGHDEDISKSEILKQNIVSESDYEQLEEYTKKLFKKGQEIAQKQGLILVDTKYEFGKKDGKIYLIDEIHTPDSSRYFYADGYAEKQSKSEPQKQLSKEFVRQWLIENGFQGKEGQKVPTMPDNFIDTITERYIELFEKVSGTTFQKANNEDIISRIEQNILLHL
ncbi:MAG: phosphoribosylaminoimidazolesuccinocarboxamide synthase [Cytophagales bacterium]|nr:MAG: phosphoribosylaminoimidazolesuccinocarboxamide synthase [Cytophagales bacterium]